MTNAQPTLDQRRARHAWQAVERARTLTQRAEYAREAKRLPVRIKTAGLGTAAAFLAAKAGNVENDPRSLLLNDLGDWILKERGLKASPAGRSENNNVIAVVVDGDARLLRRATEEALQYLKWLTRFAEAEIGTDQGSDS